MKKPELLSPVGNEEALKAAIEAGCDAIYLGGKFFGAREYASNFDNEQLNNAVIYAHIYNVKVYVTVNTLIYEAEVKAFLKYVDFLVSIHVDALIIQDIGMLDLLSKIYPDLELHASTQMHIHNLEGVKLLEKRGIKRVVLARETSIDNIKNIKENTNIELEIFVHGALCISYSGQCLMSSLIGGRSGNRGTCTGCCRLPYNLYEENKKVNTDSYLLSTKDLNTLENIEKLLEIGVDSLKIEGRMKKPEYVYLATTIYRKAIDSYFETGKVIIDEKEVEDLKKIFNRQFTRGFIFDEENDNFVNQYRPNHLGIYIGKVIGYTNNIVSIQLTNDIKQGDGIRIISSSEDNGCILNMIYLNGQLVNSAATGDIISFELSGDISIDDKVVKTLDIELNNSIGRIIDNGTRKIELNGKVTCYKDEPICLKLQCDSYIITKYSDYNIEESLRVNTSKERIYEQINKLGGTPYQFNELIIDADEDIFVKIDQLNKLRREAILELTELRLKREKKEKKEYHINIPDFNKKRTLNVLINNKEDYNFIKDKKFDIIYTDNKDLYYDIKETILKLPRVILKYPEYKENLLVGELGSIYKYDLIDTDFSLNVVNSYAVAFLHSLGVNKITLSYELNEAQIRNIIEAYRERYNKIPNLEIIIYSRPEIMISKFNLLKYYNIEYGYLEDSYKNRFPVIEKDKLMYIYLYKPIIHENYEKYYDMGINSLRINILDKNDYKNIDNLLRN